MPTVDYEPVATAVGANVDTQVGFVGSGYQTVGFQSGTSQSKQFNKVWRQASMFASALANWISVALGGVDVLDDGNRPALTTLFADALAAVIAAAVPPAVTARAWVSFNGVGGVTIHDSHNVASVVRTALGEYVITFTTPMSSANYALVVDGGSYNSPTGGTFTRAEVYDASGGGANPTAGACTIAGIYTSGGSLALNDLERCDVLVFAN